MNTLKRMFNSTQRTFILNTFDFNIQQRLNQQQRALIIHNINDDKIKVNKLDLYYENCLTLED